ncbi:MAG: D-alanyl-D-alanine carboxypeptidase family protein [Cyanobacteria bacterium P01_A01_bin.84]
MKVRWQQFAILFVFIFVNITLVSTVQKTYSQSIFNAPVELQSSQECFNDESLGDRSNISKLCGSTFKEKKSPLPIISPQGSSISPNTNLTGKQRFLAVVSDSLQIAPVPNSLDYILLKSYGAAFINKQPGIKLPKKVIFSNDQETRNFQATLTKGTVKGTRNCTLQKPAAEALNKARSRVRIPLKSGYTNSDCMRSYAITNRFWRKYANSKTLDLVRQGKEKRILGIVAPPGSSQHLWGLAIDLRVSSQAQVKALNDNGWYRTVENDKPHWTYVGSPKAKLKELGFHNKVIRGVTYWLTPL